ncbi:MAG: HD domain-containing protein [Bacteroidales bacterium]|nr:HD domain-containing protein [Bacteroidales bacterium]
MIKERITEIENQWLKSVYDYNCAQFQQCWLPSHDNTHHFRVWTFIKGILEQLDREGEKFSKEKIFRLLIAAFFHDIGLTHTLDKSHGRISREMCEHFFKEKKLPVWDGHEEMLDAIEFHDDKDYTAKKGSDFENPGSIYNLLTVSDDLDAFGALGIYRYIEIYTLRKIPVEELAPRILDNLKNRYVHFINKYGFSEELVQMHEKSYNIAVDFFSLLIINNNSDYQTEVKNIVILLINGLVKNKIYYEEFVDLLDFTGQSKVFQHFFKQFRTEVETSRNNRELTLKSL